MAFDDAEPDPRDYEDELAVDAEPDKWMPKDDFGYPRADTGKDKDAG